MSTANKNFVIFLYLSIFLILLSGLRPVGFDFDSEGYYSLLLNKNYSLEPTFSVISYIATSILTEPKYAVRLLFFIYALTNILVLAFAIYRFVGFNILSLLLYFLLSYAMLTLTQIRFGVSVAFLLWALSDLLEAKKKMFWLKILIGSCFHYSIVLTIPFVFLKKDKFNKVFYLLLPIASLVLMALDSYLLNLLINNVSYLSEYLAIKLKAYAYAKITSPMPLFNILSVLIFTFYYLTILLVDIKKDHRLILLIKATGWCVFFYFSLSFMEVFSKRILFTISTLYIVFLPIIFRCFKQKFLVSCVVVLYSLVYFVNLTIRHNLLDYGLYFDSLLANNYTSFHALYSQISLV